jgi:uncharacterized heparinase superfamily protein
MNDQPSIDRSVRLAGWSTVSAAAMASVGMPAAHAALDRAVANLRAQLAAHGAVPAGDMVLRSTDDMVTNAVAYLAETRALIVRHTNPFPRLDLFPRLSRLPWMGAA